MKIKNFKITHRATGSVSNHAGTDRQHICAGECRAETIKPANVVTPAMDWNPDARDYTVEEN